jgi:hypothetical protein
MKCMTKHCNISYESKFIRSDFPSNLKNVTFAPWLPTLDPMGAIPQILIIG